MSAGERIYFDHNASSPLRPEAWDAMRSHFDSGAANPSSLHCEGRAARACVEQAREQVAALAGVACGEVVFTSGGTEAISAAFHGVCSLAPASLRRLVVTTIEHSAVLEAARAAEARGFECERVAPDRDGRVDAAAYIAALQPGTALAALQWANNETGVLQPVAEVGKACRTAGVPFLVDAVQAAGKLPLDAGRLQADLVALSAHKFGGPQGVGALIVRQGVELISLIHGGAQEKRRRAGTPAVASIVAFGAAAAAVHAQRREESERMLRMRAKLESRIRQCQPQVVFHGEAVPRLPNTVNFSIPGVEGELLAIALDLRGVSLSTGSACASGAVEPSHVIRAMGFSESEARGAVRLSLGWNSRSEDVDRFMALLPDVVRQVRQGQPEAAG